MPHQTAAPVWQYGDDGAGMHGGNFQSTSIDDGIHKHTTKILHNEQCTNKKIDKHVHVHARVAD